MPNIFPFSVCNCFSVRSLHRFIPRDVEDDQRLVLPSLSFLALPPPAAFALPYLYPSSPVSLYIENIKRLLNYFTRCTRGMRRERREKKRPPMLPTASSQVAFTPRTLRFFSNMQSNDTIAGLNSRSSSFLPPALFHLSCISAGAVNVGGG